MAPKNVEEVAYRAVQMGELEIDEEGRIWRVAARRWDRWTKKTRTLHCQRRRAERLSGQYLQVRVMIDGKRANALAHRLVYRHFNGPIPDRLTVNHENGKKQDNNPKNLTLATYTEQQIHATRVLKVGHACNQNGQNNSMAKLTPDQVATIRHRRSTGELLKSIANDYGVSDRCISKIALGHRWASRG